MLASLSKSSTDSGPFTRPSNRIGIASKNTKKGKIFGKKPKKNSKEKNNNTRIKDITCETGEGGVCCECGCDILDRYYLTSSYKQWHMSCLKCTSCGSTLEHDRKSYVRDGRIYCKDDFYRHFTLKKCSRCLIPLSCDELVMKARGNVYHIHCFLCVLCNKVLTTGESFGVRDNMIFCQNHYDPLMGGGLLPAAELSDTFENIPDSPGLSALFEQNVSGPDKDKTQSHKKKKKKKRSSNHGDDETAFLEFMETVQFGADGFALQQPKQKRVRTSFKHHQLRILKNYFNDNTSPDGNDLKELSQKTGLTKRVLQVWFQNARAKLRRVVSKVGTSQDSPHPSASATQEQNVSPENISDNTINSNEYADECSGSSASQVNDVRVSSQNSFIDYPELLHNHANVNTTVERNGSNVDDTISQELAKFCPL